MHALHQRDEVIDVRKCLTPLREAGSAGVIEERQQEVIDGAEVKVSRQPPFGPWL
jgi:hypothetical protein